MNPEISRDQQLLGDTVARFLNDKFPGGHLHRQMSTAAMADNWQLLCVDLGMAGVHVEEQYGGAGLGPAELATVLGEMGRVLYKGPYFSTVVMAATTIQMFATEAQKQTLLPKITAGQMTATVAVATEGDWQDADFGLGVSITRHGDDQIFLDGSKYFVPDLETSDVVIVSVGTSMGTEFYYIEKDNPGVTIESLQALDFSREIGHLHLENVKATKLGDPKPCDALLPSLLNLWYLALAHESVAAAEVQLNQTLDYLKLRVQFGRTIGSFQALKHRCADMYVELELAKSAVIYATNTIVESSDDASEAVSMAKATASDILLMIAKESIQMRGGIGFTWEDESHHWYRRAISSNAFLGTPRFHRERMMQQREAL